MKTETCQSEIASLPPGWALKVVARGRDHFLVLVEPSGEETAFGCDHGLRRSLVLDKLVESAT